MKSKSIKPIFIGLPIFIFVATILYGRYPIALSTFLRAIAAKFFPSLEKVEPYYTIIWEIRMPRALASAAVGAALAISGVAFQSIFRNPLVNSSALGVSQGAGFGAALAIVLFTNSNLATYGFSFFFGIVAVILSYMIGRIYESTPTIMLVLGGSIISSIFSSLISLLKYIADPFDQLPAITFWLMGSFASVEYKTLLLSLVPILLGSLGIFSLRWRINVLSMEDKEAHSLGINLRLEKGLIILFATLATAGAVCLSGTIGWIGLIVPHMARRIVGSDNKVLVPVSSSIGASFLMLVDTVSRTLTAGEIPIGILTSIIGGPFFIYILKKTKGSSSYE